LRAAFFFAIVCLLMKAYVLTTGVIFGLITAAHVARIVAEGRHLATEPLFMLLTVASTGLCVWAATLLRRGSQTRP
jgi:hypothetical protein